MKSQEFSEDIIKKYLDAEIYVRRGMTREEYVRTCKEKWDAMKYDPHSERKIIIDFLLPFPFEPIGGQTKDNFDFFESFETSEKNPEKRNDIECFAVNDVIFRYKYNESVEIVGDINEEITKPDFFDFEDSLSPDHFLIALFDVLGFSDIITKIGSKGVIDNYQKLINLSILNKDYKSFTKVRVATNKYIMGTIYVPIKYAYFSDTIILWTRVEPFNFSGISTFISKCSDLMCEALNIGIPLRGSISFGEGIMHKEKSIFIGKSIVEAAKLEQTQKWIGVSLGNSFMINELREIIYPDLVVPGFCKHLKSNIKDAHPYLALNWVKNWKKKNYPELKDILNTMMASSPDKDKEKYKNTIDFITYSENQSEKETELFLRSRYYRFPNHEVFNPEYFNTQRMIIKIKDCDFVSGKFFSLPDSILSESKELQKLYKADSIPIILDENDEKAGKFFAEAFAKQDNEGIDIKAMNKFITFIKRTHIDYIDYYIYDAEKFEKQENDKDSP